MVATGQGADGLDGRRLGAAGPRRTTRPQLFSYFKQRFAQVTNPAIDSLREDLVMSLTTWLGRGPELLADAAPTTRRLRLPTRSSPPEDLDRVCSFAAAVGADRRHVAPVAR